MYTIKEITENGFSFLEMKKDDNSSSAKICLNEGARLQELKFSDVFIIKEQSGFDYKESYASSILFPFASRIKGGKYKFNEDEYQFNCNDNGKNALHGLVYDKKFVAFESKENEQNCSVTLNYLEKNESIGFPFKYFISAKYTLFKDQLKLKITVKNMDNKSFPFVLGWHPYFISEDLKNSALKFKTDKKIVFNENLITKKVEDYKAEEIFKIEDKHLDDCFILNDENVEFITPNYQIEISTNQIENYLQLYTPEGLPIIAIEPMTGISNSFNNKIGLQVLKPKKSYSLTWNINFKNN
jgi:aldose 1-epimerase